MQKEMKRLKMTGAALIMVLSIGASSVCAQVTIGAILDPNEGTMLDLKQWVPDTDNATATKGMMLPRVQLTDLNKLYPMFQANYNPAENSKHVGLMVYHTQDSCKPLFPGGIYVWNGTKWTPFMNDSGNSRNSMTDNRDGNTYYIGNFGSAGTWMTENLRYIPTDTNCYPGYTHNGAAFVGPHPDKRYAFPNPVPGAAYPTASDNLTAIEIDWKARAHTGVLYNWPAALNIGNEIADPVNLHQGEGGINEGPSSYVRGVCPVGWHVPSDKEWNDLEEVIALSAAGVYSSDGAADWPVDANGKKVYRTTVGARGNHGTKMKNVPPGSIGNNGSSKTADMGGFDVFLVGDVSSGTSNDFGWETNFWSSSSNDSNIGWNRFLIYGQSAVTRGSSSASSMFSVRCKRDN
ncbi:MAG: hypothetical protein LBH58_06840 [Tannerellaceae bacterium]|jgi:uncharacterized protein (TIGR02145 family)|nr:hypothetical protein [Tannerellaceae bacterium]